MLGPSDSFGAGFRFTILAPLTTTHRGLLLPVEVAASAETGLHAVGYIVRTLLGLLIVVDPTNAESTHPKRRPIEPARNAVNSGGSISLSNPCLEPPDAGATPISRDMWCLRVVPYPDAA